MSARRTLPAALIPTHLWKDGTLRLPRRLYEAYQSELARAVPDLGSGSVLSRIIGGVTAPESLTHFRERFENSAGRACVAALDPEQRFASLSDYLQQALSDGSVAILDIPCGAGATTAALITLMTELRALAVVPTTPLTLRILGAEASETALGQYRRVLADAAHAARGEGIDVSFDCITWNARDRPSTEALCARWLRAAGDADEFVVLVSNFSGANVDEGFFQDFERSFEYICTRLGDRHYTVFWIEPCSKDATKKLFPRLRRLMEGPMRWLGFSAAPDGVAPCCSYELWKESQGKFVHTNVTFARISRV